MKRFMRRVVYPKSFFRLQLAGFVLVILPMTGLMLQTLWSLSQLANDSHEHIARAVQLSGGSRALSEHSVMMERAARQYLVLRDAEVFRRYEYSQQHAHRMAMLLQPLASPALSVKLESWLNEERNIARLLRMRTPSNTQLTAAFRRLAELNADIVEVGGGQIDAQANVLVTQVERETQQLSWLLFGMLGVALGLAFGFGILVNRPVQQLARAIRGLGTGELREPIHIQGSADLEYLGQRLDVLRRQLAELQEEKRQFLRHMSHELKMPLSAIREGVELLAADEANQHAPDTARQTIIGLLQQHSQNLNQLISDLLAYDAARFSSESLAIAPCRIDQLLQLIAEDWHARLKACSCELKLDVEPITWSIDAEKCRIMIENLLSNAVKFIATDGQIQLVGRVVNDQLEIHCIDNGIGIATQDRSRIFEMFYQGSRHVSRERGCGIGLSLAAEYARLHGGHIELHTSECGAHFCVTMPRPPINDAHTANTLPEESA